LETADELSKFDKFCVLSFFIAEQVKTFMLPVDELFSGTSGSSNQKE